MRYPLVFNHCHRSARKAPVRKQRMKFARITVNPARMDGVPCIRGLRIPVATVVGMVADGMSTAEILDAYPDLDRDDIQEALLFAAEAVRERALPLANPE
jgi:uncharacterized protein (DUF433 family)